MTIETNAAPDVAADTATSEIVETPASTPESNEATEAATPEQTPEKSDPARAEARMQRRIDRVTAARYQAEAEARHLREQLARYERQTQQEEPQQFKPEDIDRLATEKAQRLREMESVQKRSTEIRDALVKEVGGDKLPKVLASVIEEAGPLAFDDGSWTPLGEAISDSDHPQKLLVYLSQNPEAAESLQGLTPAQLGRRIARIESEMSKPQPKPSSAPKPLEPIKGNGSPEKDPATMTDAEYAAWRRHQIAQRR